MAEVIPYIFQYYQTYINKPYLIHNTSSYHITLTRLNICTFFCVFHKLEKTVENTCMPTSFHCVEACSHKTSLTPSLLKCLYQDRIVSGHVFVCFRLFLRFKYLIFDFFFILFLVLKKYVSDIEDKTVIILYFV